MFIPRPIARAWGLAALLTAPGCVSSVHGRLLLNDAPFQSASCHNGGLMGFAGVELRDPAGGRVRLALDPGGTGATQAVVFAPGSMAPAAVLPACGVMELRSTGVRVNGVTALQGTASLSCSDGRSTLAGRVEFNYCH